MHFDLRYIGQHDQWTELGQILCRGSASLIRISISRGGAIKWIRGGSEGGGSTIHGLVVVLEEQQFSLRTHTLAKPTQQTG